MTHNWDITQDASFAIYLHDGQVCDGHTDEPIAVPGLTDIVNDSTEAYEVTITFRSIGHHEDMSMYGGPEQLGWPESHDDERTLVDCSIDVGMPRTDGYTRVSLTKDMAEGLFSFYESRIETEELNVEVY